MSVSKRIGEDASEKLGSTPGVFTVERHIRGKWACEQCETLIQAPVPAHFIDKGILTAGLLAHVMVAKFADHLPLVEALREAVLTHGGVHADETPVQMLSPGAKKTHRAYVWAYATSQFSDSFMNSVRAVLANMPEPSLATGTVALKLLFLLDFRHKKRRPWTSLDDEVVEPGGFEPPSASTPLSVLHA